MKSVTEFPSFTLNQGLKTKAALTAEGKTPEEIQASLGETFKYEGDKLKYFWNALEAAGPNTENMKRVLVLSLNEGENAPPKALKVDEMCYLVEFHVDPKAQQAKKGDDKRGGRGGKGRGGDRGKKESPWGLSPEEKAAKLGPKGGAKGGAPKPNTPS